jgi:hypothetical protein
LGRVTGQGAEWRDGLARLATALIGYGVVGLVVAAIGVAALVSASGRIGSLGDRIVSEAVSLDTIIVATADVLDDAATTAKTFGPTLAQTTVAVRDAAASVKDIEPRLRELETQANAIDIFGNKPVAPLGQLFGQIATDVSGLDEKLGAVADELGTNETALNANADSLGALADLVRAYKGRLKPAAIDAGIEDARRLLLITLGLFIGWTAVPAAGSLIVGRWMRGLVGPAGRGAGVGPGDRPGVTRGDRPGASLSAERAPIEPDPLPAESLPGRVPREEDQDLEGDR